MAPLAVNCFPTQIIQKSSKCTLSAMDSRNEKKKETREAKSKLVVMGIEEKVGSNMSLIGPQICDWET